MFPLVNQYCFILIINHEKVEIFSETIFLQLREKLVCCILNYPAQFASVQYLVVFTQHKTCYKI